MLEFACPHCHAPVSARPEEAGQRFDCPRCGKRFKVPGAAAVVHPSDDLLDWDDHPAPPAHASDADQPRKEGQPDSPNSGRQLREETSTPPTPANEHRSDESWDDLSHDERVSPGHPSRHANPADSESVDVFSLDQDPVEPSSADPFDIDLSQWERESTAVQRTSPAAPLPPGSSSRPPSTEENVPGGKERRDQPAAVGQSAQFGISCGVCEARILVKPADVGKTIRCPDCYSDVEVKAPSEKKKPAYVPREQYASFPLSAAPTTPKHESLLPGQLAADMLARAEKELDDEGEDRFASYYDDVPQIGPWLRDVCGFLLNPQVVARIAVLGCVLWFLVSATSAAMAMSASGNALGNFALLGAFVCIAVMGIPASAFMAVTCLTILQDTAHDRPQVDSWPDLNFLDWIPETLYVVSSFVVAGLPGWVVYQAVGFAGLSKNIGLFAMVFSEFLLFPFVLLSVLEAGSPWVPYSRVVIDSVNRFKEPWGAFLFPSTILAFVVFVLLMLIAVFGIVMDGIASFLIITIGFIYFRLLGRLGGQITSIDVTSPRERHSAAEDSVEPDNPKSTEKR